NGTAGLEAAILGKPVIAFGRRVWYGFLPHVMVVNDEAEIQPYVRRALDGQIDVSRARLDGARFQQALLESTFEAPNLGSKHLANYGTTDEIVRAAFNNLISTFEVSDKSDNH